MCNYSKERLKKKKGQQERIVLEKDSLLLTKPMEY